MYRQNIRSIQCQGTLPHIRGPTSRPQEGHQAQEGRRRRARQTQTQAGRQHRRPDRHQVHGLGGKHPQDRWRVRGRQQRGEVARDVSPGGRLKVSLVRRFARRRQQGRIREGQECRDLIWREDEEEIPSFVKMICFVVGKVCVDCSRRMLYRIASLYTQLYIVQIHMISPSVCGVYFISMTAY